MQGNVGQTSRSQVPKSNITKQERIRLAKLKKDKDRVVFTVVKGVAMVVMDKEDYIQKAELLLTQPAHMTIDRDPTSQIKANSSPNLRKSKRILSWVKVHIKQCILQVACPQSFMDYPKSIKLVSPLGLLHPAGVQLCMG